MVREDLDLWWLEWVAFVKLLVECARLGRWLGVLLMYLNGTSRESVGRVLVSVFECV